MRYSAAYPRGAERRRSMEGFIHWGCPLEGSSYESLNASDFNSNQEIIIMNYETAEIILERKKKARILARLMDGSIKKLSKDVVAYNIDDTASETPGITGISDWDEYWKHCTGQKFMGQTCASCGCALDSSNRKGAHIRLEGEIDNTRNAWIALFCTRCNNSKEKQKVRAGAWIVAITMSRVHKNVNPKWADFIAEEGRITMVHD